MPKYAVVLEGKNFPVMAGCKTDLLGFYTTRVVKASDEREAEQKAISLIRHDPDLLDALDRSSNSEPKIFVNSIMKVKWWRRTGGVGYTFFEMNE